MASLKQIKRRISGVTSTRQITRAMKMVAAAKMKRAQTNMETARPYAWRLREVIASIAAHTSEELHPLLEVREPKRIGIVTVTSDRGLCGSFNVNISRRTQKVLEKYQGYDVQLFTIGRKGNEFFRKRGIPIYHYFPSVFGEMDFSQALDIGREIVELYTSGSFDRIILVYNEFKNAVSQNIVEELLLPIIPEGGEETKSRDDFLFEPSARTVLDSLLPMHINVQLWRVILESFAAEQAARMTAMENATENASELIYDLTLQYNKVRQSMITKEILEIVSGAEGLK